ncbi:MAG: ribonuclease HI [Alphaproteobacteria bacterium]|jgi:ribonuclease HI|nr:ribonuclease HI [Alphaproteobacteria bacterium]
MQPSLDLFPPAPKPATLPVAEAYTDGACSGNPGPGGWAYLIKAGGQVREASGGAAATTNNQMELTAVIELLQSLPQPHALTIHTDSQYVLKGFTEWLPGWRRKGWRTAQGKPVENRALWEALQAAAAPHKLAWVWVKGHAGNPLNERVDRLAVAAIPTR